MTALVYILCFLVSMLLSLGCTHWVIKVACSRGWLWRPASGRHIHKKSVPRLGGVAIFSSFVCVAAFAMFLPNSWRLHSSLGLRETACLGVSVTTIFLLGLYDDIRGIGPHTKFAIQAVAGAILYAGGIGVQRLDLYSTAHALRTPIALPVTIVWMLLITNAYNLIDGLDGLAAGSAFFSTIVLFVMSLFVPHHGVAMLTIILAGVILGFLPHNFHPASIFLGDSGSMFIGFMLATLALWGSEKAPITIAVAIPVLSFGFPILDVALAVSRRFLSGKSIFSADADHIHHKLLKRGLSQRGAVLVLYAVTAIFALLSLILLHDATLIALVLVSAGVGTAIGVHYLGYVEFREARRFVQHTALQKRLVANNVEVRRAIEAMDSCEDPGQLCAILKASLQSLGFDGLRIEHRSAGALAAATSASLNQAQENEIELVWDEHFKSVPNWELRFDLTSENQRRQGYCALLRSGNGNAVLVDLNILISDFRVALSGALERITGRGKRSIRVSMGETMIRAKTAHTLK